MPKKPAKPEKTEEKIEVKGFLDEMKRVEGYTADYFMKKYGNRLPQVIFPFALLFLVFFSLVFATVPDFCPWGRTVTTIIDVGVLVGAIIIGSLVFYEAMNTLMVVLNALLFFISKLVNREERKRFDRDTFIGTLLLLVVGFLYLTAGVVAAKLIGDNAGRALACWKG